MMDALLYYALMALVVIAFVLLSDVVDAAVKFWRRKPWNM